MGTAQFLKVSSLPRFARFDCGRHRPDVPVSARANVAATIYAASHLGTPRLRFRSLKHNSSKSGNEVHVDHDRGWAP